MVITKEKLKIYQKYGGDQDGFARMGSAEEKNLMANEDWSFIDTIVEDLTMLQNGVLSAAYAERIESQLKEACDDLETIQLFKNLNI